MIKRTLEKLRDRDFIKLSQNVFYLILTNGVNFILPISIIPFLLQKLGIDKFGLVMTAQALMSFLLILPEYSFNNTGTQLVSINRENKYELERIFNSVFTTKLFLISVSFLMLIIILFIYPRFWEEKTLFLLSFGIVIGKTLLPVWFFQGIEQMKFIAYANIVAKILLAFFITSFITDKSQYLYVNFFYSIGDIIAGLFSTLLLKKVMNIHIKITNFASVKEQLKSGWHLLVITFSINTYVNANILILGALTNNSVAGMYSVAEKVMLFAKQIASIFLQATYPHLCKLIIESETKSKLFLRLELLFFFIFFSLLGIGLFLFSSEICIFFNKVEIVETTNYIKYFSIVPLIVSLNMPAYQSLIIHGLKKELTIINVVGAIGCVILNYCLIPFFSATGTVIAIIVTELVLSIGINIILIFKYKKHKFI